MHLARKDQGAFTLKSVYYFEKLLEIMASLENRTFLWKFQRRLFSSPAALAFHGNCKGLDIFHITTLMLEFHRW